MPCSILRIHPEQQYYCQTYRDSHTYYDRKKSVAEMNGRLTRFRNIACRDVADVIADEDEGRRNALLGRAGNIRGGQGKHKNE